ncbi:MAG: ABC transporter ATP-binding protein [Gammaproteobacteria bacterium]|nr:ABC transporter ATP-binding protein [Gammaproteobacteria bacterium]
MSLLNICQLGIRYGDVVAVDDLSFAIDSGESVGLVGESGSGKTQTALAILGLLPATAEISGSIKFAGEEFVGADDRAFDKLRATRVSIVFQDPTQALNPYLRIGEQLRRILIAHNIAAGAEADARVIETLESVGLPDPKRQSGAYPHQLSGGMRQRAMIASALITSPDLLIADEPTTALDVTVQAQILELLDTIRKDTALLLITHDLGVVAGHCDRMLVLENGGLVESGATRQVFGTPKCAHTVSLLEAAPRLKQSIAPQPVSGKALLRVDGASVSYREPGYGRLHAVKSVDLALRKGETVAIVGESGSGKSSLVRALLGLVAAESGAVSFLGETLPRDARSRRQQIRRELQLIFQDPAGSLNPQMRVSDIVVEPLSVHEPSLDRRACRERVIRILEQVDLGAEFLQRYPHELSGGQAQRVAIARALIVEPKVLICDEAVAALDGTVREQILKLLQDIQGRTGLSILFISHDLGVVSSISHRVLVMYLGRLVECADGQTVFGSPKHPYTRALIDAVPVPDPEAGIAHTSLSGEVPSILSPPTGCAFHPRCAYAESRCTTELPAPTAIGATTVCCHRATEIDLQA